ncbi:hypothetical protein FBQ85_15260, partial [Cytophagia bacterium CHB2]|nr:hypothetical protein [Cytophagia bacterium CHB2]
MQFKHATRTMFVLAVLIKSSIAQEVIVHADVSQTLEQRWNWANGQSKQTRFQKGFWIGYS